MQRCPQAASFILPAGHLLGGAAAAVVLLLGFWLAAGRTVTLSVALKVYILFGVCFVIVPSLIKLESDHEAQLPAPPAALPLRPAAPLPIALPGSELAA